MNTPGTFFDLLLRINNLRYLIVTAGQQHSPNSPEFLRYSEELDKLIIKLQVQNS